MFFGDTKQIKFYKKNIKHIDNKIKALMIRGNNERD